MRRTKFSEAQIAANAFTHAWIVGRSLRAQPTRGNLTLTWRRPESTVDRITGSVTQAEGAIASTAH
jgi:hypothetical protein